MLLPIIHLLFTLQNPAFAGPEVVSGKVVEPNDAFARFTVALVFQEKTGEDSVCSGSILDSSHILTAGHCVEGFMGGRVVFRRDHVYDVKTGPSVRLIESVQILPGYPSKGKVHFRIKAQVPDQRASQEYIDNAIVTFSGGIPTGYEIAHFLGETVYPQYVVPGKPLTIIGFGVTDEHQNDEGILRRAPSKIKSLSKKQLNFSTIPSKGQACDGDSGGPAVLLISGVPYVVGVLSRSDCETVSIYTRFFISAR